MLAGPVVGVRGGCALIPDTDRELGPSEQGARAKRAALGARDDILAIEPAHGREIMGAERARHYVHSRSLAALGDTDDCRK